jgi:hypothetical protein
MNGTTHRVELTCTACHRTTVHELHYAGRLLASTRCTNCGHEVRHAADDLRTAYLHDLEQRLLTKPIRLARRMARHPVRFLVHLPGAVLRQPVKLAAELREVLRDDRKAS